MRTTGRPPRWWRPRLRPWGARSTGPPGVGTGPGPCRWSPPYDDETAEAEGLPPGCSTRWRAAVPGLDRRAGPYQRSAFGRQPRAATHRHPVPDRPMGPRPQPPSRAGRADADDQDAVELATFHRAKGPRVGFRLRDSASRTATCPSSMPPPAQPARRKRRLLYVALTRANRTTALFVGPESAHQQWAAGRPRAVAVVGRGGPGGEGPAPGGSPRLTPAAAIAQLRAGLGR